MFQSMFWLVELSMVLGTILAMTFVICLSIPDSKLQEFLKPIMTWCFVAFCAFAYVISPIDLAPEVLFGPFGLIDDAAVAVGGMMAVFKALKAAKDQMLKKSAGTTKTK